MSEFYWVPDGCIPDLPDFRDWVYENTNGIFAPAIVDLRDKTSVIENQGGIGACVANSIVGAIELLTNKLNKPYEDLSRLFIYYNARSLEGSIGNNDPVYGVSIRSAIKTCVDIGVCTEALWPYSSVLWNIVPNRECYVDAVRHRPTEYYSILEASNIRIALAEGYGVIFGIVLYESFGDTDSTGVVPPNSGSTLSGHSMLIVGYNDNINKYIVRNSWGSSWGNDGYCFMDYDDIHTRGYNFWIIKQYRGDISDDPTIPGQIPLVLLPQPPSGVYTTEKVLTFFVNKGGEIRISINTGPYFTYSTPIPIVESCEITYYFKGDDNLISNKAYLSYTIDLIPIVVTPSVPSGTYETIDLDFTSNIVCDIFIINADFSEEKFESPIRIDSSRSVTVYAKSASGVVYPAKTYTYNIDPLHKPLVRLSHEPGHYFKPLQLELMAYDLGNIEYYLNNSGVFIEYTSPIAISTTTDISYRHIDGDTNVANFNISSSGIVYRVNGGDWIEYTGPIEIDRMSVVEAAPVNDLNDINVISYTALNCEEDWVILG